MDVKFYYEQLKDILNKKGPAYLTQSPFDVYTTLSAFSESNPQETGAILLAIINGIPTEAQKPDVAEADLIKISLKRF